MKKYVLVYEYDSKSFMDVNKIIAFKRNLEKVNKEIKMIFYGKVLNEELAVFMSYFNNLVGQKLCDFSVSTFEGEVVFEKGINNKSIKAATSTAKKVNSKSLSVIAKEVWGQDVALEIKFMPVMLWEKTILDLT